MSENAVAGVEAEKFFVPAPGGGGLDSDPVGRPERAGRFADVENSIPVPPLVDAVVKNKEDVGGQTFVSSETGTSVQALEPEDRNKEQSFTQLFNKTFLSFLSNYRGLVQYIRL